MQLSFEKTVAGRRANDAHADAIKRLQTQLGAIGCGVVAEYDAARPAALVAQRAQHGESRTLLEKDVDDAEVAVVRVLVQPMKRAVLVFGAGDNFERQQFLQRCDQVLANDRTVFDNEHTQLGHRNMRPRQASARRGGGWTVCLACPHRRSHARRATAISS